MTWVTVVEVLAALYFLFWVSIMKTENFQSAIVFKMIPMVLAFALGAAAVIRYLGI